MGTDRINSPREAKAPGGYFDDRADSRYFFTDVGGVIVHIKENLDTTAHFAPVGEVFFAYRVDGHLYEGQATDVNVARQRIPRHVRAVITLGNMPTIGAWIPLRLPEEAMTCPECGAMPGVPCTDEDGPLMDSGAALIVGAPWQPEPHEETLSCPYSCYSRQAVYLDTLCKPPQNP